MQNEYGLVELHRVHRAISPVLVVFQYFQHHRATKAAKNFRGAMAQPVLREVERVTKKLAHVSRKCTQVLLATAHPDKRFFLMRHVDLYSLWYRKATLIL